MVASTTMMSATRHAASADADEFIDRWSAPNRRNRSYELRSSADPIATHDHVPERRPQTSGWVDRRRLPPSRYGDDDKHVPQILQQEWKGTTSFKLNKLVDYRQYPKPKEPFRPSTVQTRTDFMITSATNFGGTYKRRQRGQSTPASIAREYDTLKRRLYELNAQARRVAGSVPSRTTLRYLTEESALKETRITNRAASPLRASRGP